MVNMNINTAFHGTKAVIKVEGKFTASCRQEFNAAIRSVLGAQGAKEIEVDIGEVDYIDSSACGMLALLRSKAVEHGREVVISGAKGAVKQTLMFMGFNQLFTFR